MIKTTVGAALKQEVGGYVNRGVMTGHTIYLVRDGEVVLYIGKSYDPLNRLKEHIGKTSRSNSPSSLGELILDNRPESLNWTMELHTFLDCSEYVASYSSFYYEGGYQHIVAMAKDNVLYAYNDFAIMIAERSMIDYFHPCLNVADNSQPIDLPEKYKNHVRPGDSSARYLPTF